MKRFILSLCCPALLLVLLATPAQAALMDYTVSFTAQNFYGGTAEPVPMDPVTGSFVFSWDDSLGLGTAVLKSFDLVFGSYTPPPMRSAGPSVIPERFILTVWPVVPV